MPGMISAMHVSKWAKQSFFAEHNLGEWSQGSYSPALAKLSVLAASLHLNLLPLWVILSTQPLAPDTRS